MAFDPESGTTQDAKPSDFSQTTGSMKTNYSFRAKVWLYPGMAGWHFVTLPKKISREIKTRFSPLKKGWGSIRVEMTLGKTLWKTSIFPDSKLGSYVLPLKSGIRKKEHVLAEDTIELELKIIV